MGSPRGGGKETGSPAGSFAPPLGFAPHARPSVGPSVGPLRAPRGGREGTPRPVIVGIPFVPPPRRSQTGGRADNFAAVLTNSRPC